MQHDWVFDVLRDLKSYAVKNGFPALAARVEATLAVAEAEIAAAREGLVGQPGGGAPGHSDKTH